MAAQPPINMLPSLGTHGLLLYMVCGTGGGCLLWVVVDWHCHLLLWVLASWTSLFGSQRQCDTLRLTIGVPHQPFGGGAVGIDPC